MQVAAVTRQAAVAARAHADRLREAEVAHEAEVARIKSEASSAITALMQASGALALWPVRPGGVQSDDP